MSATAPQRVSDAYNYSPYVPVRPHYVSDHEPLAFERALRQARHLIELGVVYPGIVSGHLPQLKPRVISTIIQHVARGTPKGGRLSQGFGQFAASKLAPRMLLYHLMYERFTATDADDVDRIIEAYQLFCYVQKVLFDAEDEDSLKADTTLKRMLDLQRGIQQGELVLVACRNSLCRATNLTVRPARGHCHHCGTAL
jgi:hypothetical protein